MLPVALFNVPVKGVVRSRRLEGIIFAEIDSNLRTQMIMRNRGNPEETIKSTLEKLR